MRTNRDCFRLLRGRHGRRACAGYGQRNAVRTTAGMQVMTLLSCLRSSLRKRSAISTVGPGRLSLRPWAIAGAAAEGGVVHEASHGALEKSGGQWWHADDQDGHQQADATLLQCLVGEAFSTETGHLGNQVRRPECCCYA